MGVAVRTLGGGFHAAVFKLDRMEEHISLLTDNFNKIKECWLHKRSHTFCVDCLERNKVVKDPCQLCRPFYAIPDNGCGGYSREYLMENLVDLHKSFVERNLSCDEKTIDLPLVEQFTLKGAQSIDTQSFVAWLDNKIYVTYFGINSVRVFTDQTPFTELPERIHIEKLDDPWGMVGCTISNSIFISDTFCIWKIQLPDNELSRILVYPQPEHLSITPDNELLAVIRSTSLDIFSLKDFSRTKTISVPFHYDDISCAAQLPNKNIVISYSKDDNDGIYWICILTAEGDIIKIFDPNIFKSIQCNSWCPVYFTVSDNGRLLIVDQNHGRLFVFDSQMTNCHLLSKNQFRSIGLPNIVYIKDRQQLLLCRESDRRKSISLSMFHLSPCNLIRGRSNESLLPTGNKSRIERKRKAKKNSKQNSQKLGSKRRK